jgi:hypothetical protein
MEQDCGIQRSLPLLTLARPPLRQTVDQKPQASAKMPWMLQLGGRYETAAIWRRGERFYGRDRMSAPR